MFHKLKPSENQLKSICFGSPSLVFSILYILSGIDPFSLNIINSLTVGQTKKAGKWLKDRIKDNRVYKISSESDPESSLESEYYQQILDARKLLTRQLAKLEKSDQNPDHENNLNKPTTSDTEDDKICDNFDPILEEDEDNKNENTSDNKYGDHVNDIQVLTNQRPVSQNLTNESRVSEQLTNQRPAARSRDHVIDIPGPLAPCYQPTLVVTNVWNSNMSMQRLYRYTTMQGIIYPPGYVP